MLETDGDISGSGSSDPPFISVSLDIGLYVLHDHASSFLAPGTMDWVEGPLVAEPMACAARTSDTSFLAVGGHNRVSLRQFQAIPTDPTSVEGWLPASTWPDLETARFGLACQVIGHKLLVSGSGATVEIVDIMTKAVSRGQELVTPRSYHQMFAFGEEGYMRLLALGGLHGVSFLPAVDWYEDEEGHWMKAWGRLRTPRSHSGGAAVSQEMVCSGQCGQEDCVEEQGGLCTVRMEGRVAKCWELFTPPSEAIQGVRLSKLLGR